ncbi:MAG TPA: FAD-dependent oxidoreductase, partial [Paenirhodobacter sp.]
MAHYKLRPPVVAPERDRSFWLQDIGAGAITPPLRGAQTADVAIIGGGYAGLWTALRLREAAPDLRITVLEADFCGSGASGRNGGQVHSWFAEIDLLTRIVGASEALALCHATAEAIDELEALQNSGQIDMDLRLNGWLWTASATAQEGAWTPALTQCTAEGVDCFRAMSAEDIRRRTGSGVSYTGIVEDRAGTVQPAKLALGLRALALARGVVIHEATPVTEIVAGVTGHSLTTQQGTLRADKVVLTANAWASALPELRRHMFVVDSHVIATAPAKAALDALGWTDGASICDSQAHVLYYQRTATDRVVFGRGTGHVAFQGRFGASFNRSATNGIYNIRELHRVYPELRDVGIEYEWSGPIDCMAQHLPVFGSLSDAPGIFFGCGFN